MITLLLGGARSGKSELAEAIAARYNQPVTYIATGTVTDGDMAARIAAHRLRRPPAWDTVEAGADLVDAVANVVRGIVLVDSLGTWVAAHQPVESVDTGGLCAALSDREAPTVLVSEEVGLGVHPSTDLGRRFRDVLGEVNRRVADVASDVYLVVAGRMLRLESVDGE